MPASKKGIDISLVIPVYNGRTFLESTTLAYLSAFEKSPLIDSFEIILATNNCSDDSPALASALAKKNSKIKHVDFPFKTLKGGAVIRGFQHAKYPFISFTDVDNATRPEEFLKLLPAFTDEKVGAAIASRLMPDSVLSPPQPFSRQLLGSAFSIIRELLFGLGVKDSQCGAKVFRRESIAPLELKNNGFTFDVELLYRVKKKGFLIREIGVRWEDQAGSTVTLFSNWRNSPFYMFWELIKIKLGI